MEDMQPLYPVDQSALPWIQTLNGEGRLQLRVSTAQAALPVAGASVVVFQRRSDQERGELLYSVQTDESGLTPEMVLPTTLKEESEHPGGTPFVEYEVQVQQTGFQPIWFQGIPVFDGITTVQPAAMIPLPDSGERTTPIQVVPPYVSQL